MEEFGVNGYAGGTINNICKKGINKGLIYHNFKDKDELYLVCLENSCKKLVSMVEESGCVSDQLQYMKLRMLFFTEYPNEAHIFFEAILQPQEKLRNRINQILEPFEEINEKIYRQVVSGISLRDGITQEDAIDYFRQMQRMFNGYFSSSAYRYHTDSRNRLVHKYENTVWHYAELYVDGRFLFRCIYKHGRQRAT